VKKNAQEAPPAATPRPSSTVETALYPYADFSRATEALKNALEKGPFYGLLTGASGTGKTSLLRHVAGALDRHRVQVLYVAQVRLSPSSLGRLLAQALHVGAKRTHAETLRALAQVIRDLPQRLAVLLDEAQRLSIDAIEELRLLAESELDRGPLFAVVLAGPPEVRERLEAPELFALKRRLSVKVELTGLRADECRPFLARRLEPRALERLSPEALALLFERGRGVPALVESYAEVALEHARDGATVDKDAAAEALDAWEGL
jgi:general secretion pathway protein A